VRRKPYSVILFDEVEKAHPDVFNILLQVLDDGRITDSQGRTVDFKNTILILTSNLGSQYLLEGIDEKGEISPEAKVQVDQLLKATFRPEFLNRLDEVVCYKPLNKADIRAIVDLLLKNLDRRLADKQLSVVLTQGAKDYVIENGYDPLYGARPLRRFLQHTVETLVGRKLIAEDLQPGTVLTVETRMDGQGWRSAWSGAARRPDEMIPVPFLPVRGHGFRIRLRGTGRVTLHAINQRFKEGSAR